MQKLVSVSDIELDVPAIDWRDAVRSQGLYLYRMVM